MRWPIPDASGYISAPTIPAMMDGAHEADRQRPATNATPAPRSSPSSRAPAIPPSHEITNATL